VNLPTVVESPTESARFGLRVGRCELDGVVDAVGLATAADGFDIVVLRYPAENVAAPFELSRLPGFVSYTADHLCYWDWRGPVADVEVPAGWRVDQDPDVGDVADVVRDAFENYRNHYSANPLIDEAAALDGYCEWATHLAAVVGSAFLLRDTSQHGVGVALVDWSAELPDIKLAGMRTSAQRRGLYPVLLHAVMERAVALGHGGLRISTQSHNAKVMRVWARMGFVPVGAVATQHLVRVELLD
jgi:GNAT superfamily N-acetyltransferase